MLHNRAIVSVNVCKWTDASSAVDATLNAPLDANSGYSARCYARCYARYNGRRNQTAYLEFHCGTHVAPQLRYCENETVSHLQLIARSSIDLCLLIEISQSFVIFINVNKLYISKLYRIFRLISWFISTHIC